MRADHDNFDTVDFGSDPESICYKKLVQLVARWAYSEQMPVVSAFGSRIGISPLLQWIVVPAATAHPSRRGPAVRPVKGQEAPISRQDQGPAAPVRRAVFCDAVQLTEAANSAT